RISEACAAQNTYLVIDGIQLIGNTAIDLSKLKIAGLACAAHKWLLSPTGTGFFYVNPDVLPEMKIPYSGWMHNADATTFRNTSMFDYRPNSFARRFELGTPPYILLYAFEQSLSLIRECKIAYIEEHNREFVRQLQQFFQELG